MREHNEPTLAELSGDRFEQMRAEALEVLDTDARIPYVRRRGDHLYNFWRDAANPRGLWRRTTLESYRTDDPDWDVIIDVDELAAPTTRTGCGPAPTSSNPSTPLALISLSRGGADATVVREFDMRTREFVAGGFELPEAKTDDRLGGRGHRAGRHRLRRRLADRLRLPADRQAVAARPAARRGRDGVQRASHRRRASAAAVDRTPGFERTMSAGPLDFFNDELYELRGDELIRIDVPTDADRVDASRLAADQAAHRLGRRARPTSPGSLLAANYDEFLAGTAESDGGLRARRAHLPASLRVDARQARHGHARRRRQPGARSSPRARGSASRCRTFPPTPTP